MILGFQAIQISIHDMFFLKNKEQQARKYFKVGEAHPSKVGEARIQFLLYSHQKLGRPGTPLSHHTYWNYYHLPPKI